jgi:hypothetical protein
MPLSRLQERIAELSSKAVATDNIEEFAQVASELRMALQEQISNLRGMVEDAKKSIRRIPSDSRSKNDKANGHGA